MNEYLVKKSDLQTVLDVANATLAAKIGVYSADFGGICRVFGFDVNGYRLFETAVKREPIPNKPTYSEFSIREAENLASYGGGELGSVIYQTPNATGVPTIFDYGYTFQTWLPVQILSIKDAILDRGEYWAKRYVPGNSEYRQPYSDLISFLNAKTLNEYTEQSDISFDVSLWTGAEKSVIRVNFNGLHFTLYI